MQKIDQKNQNKKAVTKIGERLGLFGDPHVSPSDLTTSAFLLLCFSRRAERMSYYYPRSKPRPPEKSISIFVCHRYFFNDVYRLWDLDMVLQMMAERSRKIHFNSPDGRFLSPACFISSLLAAADGLRVTPCVGDTQNLTKTRGQCPLTLSIQTPIPSVTAFMKVPECVRALRIKSIMFSEY